MHNTPKWAAVTEDARREKRSEEKKINKWNAVKWSKYENTHTLGNNIRQNGLRSLKNANRSLGVWETMPSPKIDRNKRKTTVIHFKYVICNKNS